jgi:hypothetical protein
MKRIRINKKTYFVAGVGVFVIACGLGYSILKGVNEWFDTHELVFNKIVQVEFNRPVEIKDRKVATGEIIRIIETVPAPEDLETDIEHYIYEVFGIEHYRMAIATFKCESGLREEAFHINSNNTIDVGIAQINSVNFKLEGCSLKEVVDANKNVDCAYKMWDRGDGEEGNERGNFSAWVGYTNGCALTKYE